MSSKVLLNYQICREKHEQILRRNLTAANSVSPPFKKVLIANRGEIAIRIAKAASGLGIKTVSVYSSDDSACLHTRQTTESYEIKATNKENASSIDAYLDLQTIINTAKKCNADCIHPGYGFLSENAEFAKLCEDNSIKFIGPSSHAIALFGSKVEARKLAINANVPVVPGSLVSFKSGQDCLKFIADSSNKVKYPVMLKASGGGGGRGMRIVQTEDDLIDMFDLCVREANAAFGVGDIFVEQYINNPRHIEVQILADEQGNTIHLFERDCSVQLRNQKVVEIAPAPNLPVEIRDEMLQNAITLVKKANYANAGTVEFLYSPESKEFYFIECNPRIQVEHTVTEQITGIDLVETQFLISHGETLNQLGLSDQTNILNRGFAIQARLTANGTGQIIGYKEPSGAGVRVDSCGYAGYMPSPQFDPLIGKIICWSPRGFDNAITRLTNALNDFYITGIRTNMPTLIGVLLNSKFQRGDARTTIFKDHPELLTKQDGPMRGALKLYDEINQGGATALNKRSSGGVKFTPLTIKDGQTPVVCGTGGSVIDVLVQPGDYVFPGDKLLVLTAMKMETLINSKVKGIVTEVAPIKAGDVLVGDEVIVVIDTTVEEGANSKRPSGVNKDETWANIMDDLNARKEFAKARLAHGSEDPGVVRQRSRGKLTCRERIELLLDNNTFNEIGSAAGFASYDEYGQVEAFTPANMVGGTGAIANRPVVVCADDFTSRGGHADGAIAAKSTYLDRLATEMHIPSIRLLDGSSGGGSVAAMVPKQKKEGEANAQESSGAIKAGKPRVTGGGGSYLPGHLGSSMYGKEMSEIPVVNMLLGSVVGIGAAKAMLGHFSVMVKDISQLMVAGPPVVSHMMNYEITKEELGGWHIHATNGSIDNLAMSEEDAVMQVHRFLSYIPSSAHEIPPVMPCSDPVDRREEELWTIIPRKRTMTFDIRRAIQLIADAGSYFEIGTHWGTDQVVGFIRMDGYPCGFIASDSRHENGGALTADGCSKLTRHQDLCDLFHLPIVNFCDNPGFAVGVEHELRSTIRKGAEWMIAFAQVSVPVFTVLMRRSFGVAGNNYATPLSRTSMRIAWPSADVGGIPPEGGIEAAYKRQLAEAEDPDALRAEIMSRIEAARGPQKPASRFQIQEIIDPRDTRIHICNWVKLAYRLVGTNPKPRPLLFRP